jgi:hypothetical protein
MIDLKKMRDGFRGKPFKALIQHHVRKQDIVQIATAIEGEKMNLSPFEKKVGERLIDYFNILMLDRDFWRTDCAEVFTRYCWMANRALESGEADIGKCEAEYAASLLLKRAHFPETKEQDKLFSSFQLLVLNYAFMAHESKNFRKHAGIKKGLFS